MGRWADVRVCVRAAESLSIRLMMKAGTGKAGGPDGHNRAADCVASSGASSVKPFVGWDSTSTKHETVQDAEIFLKAGKQVVAGGLPAVCAPSECIRLRKRRR